MTTAKPVLRYFQSVVTPIEKMFPNPYNPNRMAEHEFSLLKKSMREDGFTQPVIILPTGQIVDGEHRWKAAKELGYTEIPAVTIDLDEAKRRISTIRHNTARGTHDIEAEALMLKDLEQMGQLDWAQDQLGLSNDEIDKMLNDLTPLDVYGGDAAYGQSWDYQGSSNIGGEMSERATQVARLSAAQKGRAVEDREMSEGDVKLVRATFSLTEAENERLSSALGDKRADKLLAMVDAQLISEKASGRHDEWVSLSFSIPAGALPVIKQELQRISQHSPTINQELSESVKMGLALELMAANSMGTPDESWR